MARKLSAQNRADLKAVFDEIGVERLKDWIMKVAEGEKREVTRRGKKVTEVLRSPNPGRAAELMLTLAEYVKPKLARVEQAGGRDDRLTVIVRQHGGPRKPADSTSPAPSGKMPAKQEDEP